MVALSAALLAAGLARAEPRAAVDHAYFADAETRAAADAESVLEVLVSHPRKPSPGLRRLPFQPRPDLDADPAVDCEDLEPRPSPASGEGRAEVCGVRLLRWTSGEADRIELAATGQRGAQGRRWIEVLLDPASGRRGWVQFTPPRKGVEFMRLRRLSEWVAGSGHVTFPRDERRRLPMREAPSYEAEPSGPSLDLRDDLRAAVLGVQGRWMRIAPESGAGCGREREGTACPTGWVPWRSESGVVLAYP